MQAMKIAALAVALSVAVSGVARAASQSEFEDMIDAAIRDHLKAHPEEVEAIVKDYLAAHPEIVQGSLVALFKKTREARSTPPADKAAIVREDAAALFASPHQVILGDKEGPVTMVEFFDYNCHFCRRALSDTLALLKTEPKLRIVLKEFPVLGPGSLEAARVAIAVRMQDPDGSRYLAFHQRMFGGAGPNDKATALAVANDLGFDIARLEQDMDGDEARATLAEDYKLAKDLGMTGTPSYVIADNVVIGAVGLDALEEKVKAALP